MFHAWFDYQNGRHTVFLAYVVMVWLIMLPRVILAQIFYLLKRLEWIQTYPMEKRNATVILTVYREKPHRLEKALKSVTDALDAGTKSWNMVAVIDDVEQDKPLTDQNAACLELLKKYGCYVVEAGDFRNKRKNLRELVRMARKKGLLHDLLILLDSDTRCVNEHTVAELLRPFADPRIGGVTTAQRGHDVETFMQRMGDWLENARLNSSMAAMSLFRQVSCLPGRMYAVRTHLIEHRMDDLNSQYFSYFGFWKHECKAGDDRRITEFVLEAGYDTILAPAAKVTTDLPETIEKTKNTYLRWGSSSQGSNIRFPWWKYPRLWFAWLINWSDILVTIATVYILAINWPLSAYYGHSQETKVETIWYLVCGTLLTMFIRQIPHLIRNPWDIFLLPVFAMFITAALVIRFWALIRHPILVSSWGTREGADRRTQNPKFWILYEKQA